MSSGGRVNKVPVPSEVTWERECYFDAKTVSLLHVTSETAVWWAGVTPLGRLQAHIGVKTHTHKHTHIKIFILRFTLIVHSCKHHFSVCVCVCAHSKPSLKYTHIKACSHRERSDHRCPHGTRSANPQVTETSRLSQT